MTLTTDQSPEARDLRQREIRNRERCWLCLFSWDRLAFTTRRQYMLAHGDFLRGLATVSGRTSWTVRGEDPTIEKVETWCHHPLAAAVDRQVSARTALRKTLGQAQDALRDQGALGSSNAPPSVDTGLITALIDNFLEPWAQRWLVPDETG